MCILIVIIVLPANSIGVGSISDSLFSKGSGNDESVTDQGPPMMKCHYFVVFATLLSWETISTCYALNTWHGGLKPG